MSAAPLARLEQRLGEAKLSANVWAIDIPRGIYAAQGPHDNLVAISPVARVARKKLLWKAFPVVVESQARGSGGHMAFVVAGGAVDLLLCVAKCYACVMVQVGKSMAIIDMIDDWSVKNWANVLQFQPALLVADKVVIKFGLKICDVVGAGEPEPLMCLLRGSSGAGKLYTWRLALGFFDLTGLRQESDGRLFACHTAPVTDSGGDVMHHAFSLDAVHEQSGRRLFVDETSRGARIVQSADALEVYQLVNVFVDE